MFVLYQAYGPILGVGDTKNACLDDAEGYTMEQDTPLLGSDGTLLEVTEDYLDFTRLTVAGLEQEGELYLRRCTPPLGAYLQLSTTERSCVLYAVRADGLVDGPSAVYDAPPW